MLSFDSKSKRGARAMADNPETRGENDVTGQECLSQAEFASLVSGRCSDAETARIKEHFSQCQKCHDHWLTLASFTIAATRKKQSRPRKSRFLGYAILFFLIVTFLILLFILQSPLIIETADSSYRKEQQARVLPVLPLPPEGSG